MNVLHVILTLERAGAQEVVRTLAEQHARHGCRTHVAAFEDGPVRADLERLGVPVTVLGGRRYGIERPIRFAVELRAIRRELSELVARHAIDVVQTHLLQTLDFAALALRRAAPVAGVVVTLHNVDFLPEGSTAWTRVKRDAHRRLYRANAARIAAVVAVSERVAVEARASLGDMRGRIVVIPNGVDVARFAGRSDRAALVRELGLDETDELVLTVGRLTAQKGHVHLLRGMSTLLGARPRARLLLVGAGELERDLHDETRNLGIEPRVRFLGERTDVPRLLASTDAFVLPSLWEGLSVVLLEAMAAGAPIVATAVSGTDQALEQGRTGLVVSPGDPAALAEALAATLADRPAAAARAAEARRVVAREFSAERQAARYLELYRRVVERR